MFQSKRKNKRLSRAERQRRKQQLIHAGVAALTLTCVFGVALMSVLNRQPSGRRYTYTTTADIWHAQSTDAPPAQLGPELPEEMQAELPDVQVLPPQPAQSAETAGAPEDTAALAQAAEEAARSPEADAPFVALSQGAAEADAQPASEATIAPDAQGATLSQDAQQTGQTKWPRVLPPPTPDPTRPPATITITATGDCTLGTYKDRNGRTSNFKSFVEEYGYDYFFQNVRELFAQDDLTIINLEGPLSAHSTKRPGRTFNFRGYPEYAAILSGSSIEICNLANNHALDYGSEGFKDTCAALEAAGIGYSGYGPEHYAEVNGYIVGSLGFTEWNFEAKDILSAVGSAAKKCDLLIVSMHWGEEREYRLTKYCRQMGRALIDAGADLVIGNHSHVYGEIEKYKGKYIINSLGNFCFGGNDDPDILDCAIFRQTFVMGGDGSVTDGGIDIIPALISSNEKYNDFQPRIAEPEEGARMLREIAHWSPTLSEDDILWLEDSYARRYGLVTGAQPQPGDAPAPTMQIVNDAVR